ncbi:uncharacterized protein zgc:194242 [Chanos chanos]|uniref:Uncharacterized protein LOC115808168 n=1 Tax=Chanos chanos TaxID=29144 RepID=A0A6J2UZB1_CHACN|nr:uncharacterized protein LOC115808168 [Chanos chanos]XP_030625315.1 uncharacterized protein LOC115808168 [Chanos chanos]
MLSNKIARQLGHPTQSLIGWVLSKVFNRMNWVLEENAVKMCGISPNDTVLELGHGPGLGLEAAARLLSGPNGKLLGVDHSEYMHQTAAKRMQDLIASGKVTLHHCDVASMPFPDNSVDKVFHCNCYYFWPDLRAGAAEIHRVMKPGGLMVTALNLSRVTTVASRGWIKGKNWRPEVYMEALRDTGFTDVFIEDKIDKFITFQVMFATAAK